MTTDPQQWLLNSRRLEFPNREIITRFWDGDGVEGLGWGKRGSVDGVKSWVCGGSSVDALCTCTAVIDEVGRIDVICTLGPAALDCNALEISRFARLGWFVSFDLCITDGGVLPVQKIEQFKTGLAIEIWCC